MTLAAPDLLALLDSAVRPDPYPLYAQIREAAPAVLFDGQLGVVASFDDCSAILRSSSVGSDRRKSTLFQSRAQTLNAQVPPGVPGIVESPMFLFQDPPDHTRLRRLAAKAFTPRRVELLRDDITRITHELIDDFAGRDSVDLIQGLAYPLPITIISNLLGVPTADTPLLRAWSATLSRALDPTIALTGQPSEGMPERIAAIVEFRQYFRELAEMRRREPGDDLVSALVAARDGEDRLTEDELLSTCILLLIAGHETTVNLIANGMLALLRAPDQLRALATDPSLAPGAVEETLRYDAPVQLLARVVLEDLTLGEQSLPAGSLLLPMIAAAGRDPAAHADPDRFDILRGDSRHLAFGLGPHFCLGAPLARLEATVALSALTSRLVEPRLAAGQLSYRENVTLRGLRELPVAFDGVRPR